MKAEIVNYLKQSLADTRCAYCYYSLEELLERKDETEDKNKYRLYTETPSQDPDEEPIRNYIKTVDEFIALISDSDVTIYPQASRKGGGAVSGSIIVMIDNVKIYLNPRFREDVSFIRDGLDPNSLGFAMGYCSDNDTALPIKALSVVYRKV